MPKKNIKNKGFTLVEIMVAVSIFSIVMVISAGSIMSILDVNRKSQNLRSVMDNLNHTLEAMTRTIRFGTNFHCDIAQGSISTPRDCGSGVIPAATSISVTNSSGTLVIYRLNGTRIERSTDGGLVYAGLTSPDVTMTTMTFRVYGSAPYSSGDLYQPQVIIVLSGYVGAKATSQSRFTLETTVSQRVIDSQ